MSRPPVSNKNERALSIFKVSGMYLLTLLFFALLFLSNKKMADEAPRNMAGEYDELKMELDQLRTYFTQVDTLAGLASQLISLDENLHNAYANDRSKVGKISNSIKDAETVQEQFIDKLFSTQAVEGNAEEWAMSKDLRAFFESCRSQIKGLRDETRRLAEQQRTSDQNVANAIIDSLKNEIALVKQEADQLRQQAEVEKERVEDVRSNASGTSDDLKAEREKNAANAQKIQSLERLISEAKADLDAIYETAKAANFDVRKKNRLENEVEKIYNDLGQLLTRFNTN